MSLQQVRHSFARQLRKQRYSLQEIGKLLGHKAGSSMTIMYADMADDEVVDSGKAYLLLLKMCKKSEKSAIFHE